MICPRCTLASLDRRPREDVTIDVCLRCRGVWLDRGELETLNAHAVAVAVSGVADDDEDDEDEDDWAEPRRPADASRQHMRIAAAIQATIRLPGLR